MSLDTRGSDDLIERADWTGLRANYEISAGEAERAVSKIQHKKTLAIDGADIAVFFRVQSSGHLRFYRPQASGARFAMNADQLNAEKAKLVHTMIVGGRKGHSPTEDELRRHLVPEAADRAPRVPALKFTAKVTTPQLITYWDNDWVAPTP